jgi:DNA-binding MarR family transcriptional regulator
MPRTAPPSDHDAGTIDRAACAAAVKVCACFNLRRASRAVTRLFDEILGRGGLRSTQFVALVAIRAEGNPSLPRLARALGVDRSTLTRNLAPLVKSGLVEVSATPPSQTAAARLTSKGDKALVRCVPFWQEAQSRFEAKVGADTWHALLAGLTSVSSGAAEA